MYQLSFSLDTFMQEFWQKKPTIIKGGFANFHDPISPDELAGLSLEEDVDSRFVSNLNDNWQAEHGPFAEDKFSQVGESHWSLIVQAANHWVPEVDQMRHAFSQIPNWLFDDVMISFATENGGVGPHIDQYDVFICQGMGKRHWQVGALDEGQYQENHRTPALRQIEGFEPILDDVLEAGDILYIPAGFPHHGYALEPSLSYSMGYRSPKSQELLSNFADFVLAHDRGDVHMHQPDQALQQNPGALGHTDMQVLSQMLKSDLQDEAFINKFLGCMLSQSRHQLSIIPAEENWTRDDLMQHIQTGEPIEKVLGLRCFYHQDTPQTLYINGEIFHLEEELAFMTDRLANQNQLTATDLAQLTDKPECLDFICQLLDKGYWYIDEV
ncbi:MAG: JmjC domain-containing protein [Vibrio sp.]